MHDGPDPGPRRTRRTRADDLPAGPDDHGGDDDVLDRFGLRTSASSRAGAAARAHGPPEDPGPRRPRRRPDSDAGNPPGRRRRGDDGPPLPEGRPAANGRPGRRRRPARDDGARPSQDAPPRPGGADVVLEAIAEDRTSAMPAVGPGTPAPGTPRPDAGGSRNGTATPSAPRRRPRDLDAPAAAARSGSPPADAPPPDEGADDPPPPAGRRRRVLRIGAVVVTLLVFAACASGFASHQQIEAGVRTVAALDPESDAISNRSTQTGDENVLVLGLPPNRSAVPEPERSDTAVLVHMPAGGGQAVTLGIPPTLEVPRPPCQRWDPATGTYAETVPAESRTAFSAAFDVGGPRCAVEVVQQLTGLVVTRFVAMDMAGTAALVNSVRGVGVCTERPVVDRTSGPVVARAGETVLGGAEAERFVAADSVGDLSLADRVRRQQRVLSAVLDGALSTPSLLIPGAADRVARALPGAVMTDGAGVNELLVLSGALARTSGEDAAPTYLSVPVGEAPNTRGNLELRRSDSSDLFSAMRKHEPLPEKVLGQARLAASTALPVGTVVDVLNAAGRPGVAGEAAEALRAQGYRVGAVRDADSGGPDSLVRFSPDRAAAAEVVAASVPGARLEPEAGGTGRLEVVLGASFPGPAAITSQPRPEGSTADCG